MFYSLRGTLAHLEPGVAVIECAGIGFKCLTSQNTLRALPPQGGEVTLYTHLHVREDAVDLFGFATRTELNCFRMLTAVSGVGPKVALAVLSVLTPEQVAAASATGDSRSFTRASGVGSKLAQRIVLELRDKVRDIRTAVGAVPAGQPSAADHAGAAVNALTVLGYQPSEAASAVARRDSALPVEELIRLSLKAMDPGRGGAGSRQ